MTSFTELINSIRDGKVRVINIHSKLAESFQGQYRSLTDTSFENFCDALKQAKTVEELSIRGYQLTDDQVSLFSEYIKDDRVLTKLDLGNQKFISAKSTLDLSHAFAVNKALRYVDLSSLDGMSRAGMCDLVSGLAKNPFLETVLIDHAPVGPDSVKILAEMLMKNSALKSLTLRGTPEIKGKEGELLANAIAQSKHLEFLALMDETSADSSFILQLAKALESNRFLKKLHLGSWDLVFPERDISIIGNALHANRALEEFYVHTLQDQGPSLDVLKRLVQSRPSLRVTASYNSHVYNIKIDERYQVPNQLGESLSGEERSEEAPFDNNGRISIGADELNDSVPDGADKIGSEIFSISEEDRIILEKFGSFMGNEGGEGAAPRSSDIEQVEFILQKVKKPNVMLLGDAGVGKTALVEALAAKIAHQGRAIFQLDVGLLLSGTHLVGKLEEHISGFLKVAKKYKGKIHVFVDEFHQIIGAGSYSHHEGGGASNLLKPALSRGEISVIGATTFDEYRQYVEKDGAIARRFTVVKLEEPNRIETLRILDKTLELFKGHGIGVGLSALGDVYDLCKLYIPERKMPDIAIDILENAMMVAKHQGDKVLSRIHVAKAVAKQSGIPSLDMLLNDGKYVLGIDEFLKGKIIGQEQALDYVSSSVKNIWAGLSSSSQAVKGSYLFSGPTGVGKTETAKLLAEYLNMGFIRVDMSEYMERYSLSRLIGSSIGYEGSAQGGQLTEAVKKKQHSVVLLDEVEKAHPDVFNVLLQVLDRGFLRDGRNREVDFRHTIIIMTTNAGQGKRSVGFSEQRSGSDKAISEFFSPEFRARLDGVVDFRPLTSDSAKDISGLFLRHASRDLLAKREIGVEFSDAVKSQVAAKSFNQEQGARHIGRYVRDNVLSVLTVPLLDGTIIKGDRLRIDFSAGAHGYTWVKIPQNDNQDGQSQGISLQGSQPV